MTDLIAYHGKKEVKAKYLQRVRAHRAADELVRGLGWSNGRGCAVGCTLHAYDHARYPIELGVPEVLARLEDRIFEAVDEKRAQQWPAQFLSAIPVGADLSRVWPKFAAWVLRNICPSDVGKKVAATFDQVARGQEVTGTEWSALRGEAWRKKAADADAAYAAAYAAYAADARSKGQDGTAARASAWTRMADHLLKLLRGAPRAKAATRPRPPRGATT